MKNNLNAFKKLILRYESITIKEIEEHNGDATFITGFNSCNCSLCKAVGREFFDSCERCIWYKYNFSKNNCTKQLACYSSFWDAGRKDDKVWKTFHNISSFPFSSHPNKTLQKYFRQRAALMRKVLRELGYKEPKTVLK